LQINYSELLSELNAPKVIDFLTMDLEPPSLTFECLYKIPFDEYKFNIITFEIDEGREGGNERKSESRNYLKSKGYTLLGNLGGQDDFYINDSLSGLKNEINFFDVLLELGVPIHAIKQFNTIHNEN
jgi:hypothetical protein